MTVDDLAAALHRRACLAQGATPRPWVALPYHRKLVWRAVAAEALALIAPAPTARVVRVAGVWS